MNAEPKRFSIRDLVTYDEFVEVRRVQQTIWAFDDAGSGIYPPWLFTASRNGGVVLGAFDPEGNLIGYVLGFLGKEGDGPLKLCSQTMGVLPDWRGKGVANALKWAQRERALQAGLSLITWTFDPLENRSARLNLHKLGAICHRYWRNIYGENFGELNQGLPTDRLVAEWRIREVFPIQPHPRTETEPAEPTPVFQVNDGRITAYRPDAGGRNVWLEIPADIQSMKKANMELARDWRFKVREAFEYLFGRDYVAVNCIEHPPQSGRFGYLLQQTENPTGPAASSKNR